IFCRSLSACRRPLHCRLWRVKSLLRHRSDRPKRRLTTGGRRRRPSGRSLPRRRHRSPGCALRPLVALWEALPANASHNGAFDFPDASRSLFGGGAEMIGLMPVVRELEARLAADVEAVAWRLAPPMNSASFSVGRHELDHRQASIPRTTARNSARDRGYL